MGNEKMSNLPGTPGWIAKNTGNKKNIEKKASVKDAIGKLGVGRKNFKELMAANEKFQAVGTRYTNGEASEEELAQAREEYEPTRKKVVKSLKTRLGIATGAPIAAGLGSMAYGKWKTRKNKK